MNGMPPSRNPGHDRSHWLQAEGFASVPPRPNIAPSQLVLAVRRFAGRAGRQLVWLRWGLIPAWANDAGVADRLINALVRPFQARMPAILDPGDYAAWLDPSLQDPEQVQAMLWPFPGGDLVAEPVSRAINDARHANG